MTRLGAVQSSYIPWKGYFDLIDSTDTFVIYDDVAYSKHGWRNRNLIRVRDGVQWLTIPVATKGRLGQRINEVEIADPRWAGKHCRSLQTCYARAGAFGEVFPWLSGLYSQAADLKLLTEVNELFLREVSRVLGIDTGFERSSHFVLPEDRVDRLIELCRVSDCDTYLSGPTAKVYLEVDRFREAGIRVQWMDYSDYPEYLQVGGTPCVHEVSVLDLLLNVGIEEARRHFKGTRRFET